jgi:CelD/BcsL family acetyltransferase involved in cellulose biosynthesis
MPIIALDNRFIGKDLKTTTELYCGRSGILLHPDQSDAVEELLRGICGEFKGWRSLQVTMVSNGLGLNKLRQACERMRLPTLESAPMPSPYYPILDSSEEFNDQIAKDLKQRLKSSTKKLNATGQVFHKVFTDESSAKILLNEIIEIERNSWKHEAGTAISNNPQQIRFYEELFPRAMRAKHLFAQLMYLDGSPVAYNFGLIRDGVFSGLKISHVQSLHKLTPSYILNSAVIDNLRQMGVRIYDCMGKPEKHKLNWSAAAKIYSRTTITIFNRNLAGLSTYAARKLKSRIHPKPEAADNKFADA